MEVTAMTVETFSKGNMTSATPCDATEMYVRRDYGCLFVRIDKDSVLIEKQDGDGEVLAAYTATLDGLVEAAPDLAFHLKVLKDVEGVLKEAGIGPQPNPFEHGEEEKAGEEGDEVGG